MARNLLEIQDVALKVAVFGEGGMEMSTLAGTLARLHAAEHQVETAQASGRGQQTSAFAASP